MLKILLQISFPASYRSQHQQQQQVRISSYKKKISPLGEN